MAILGLICLTLGWILQHWNNKKKTCYSQLLDDNMFN